MKTIKKPVEASINIKKSNFIARIFPVKNKEQTNLNSYIVLNNIINFRAYKGQDMLNLLKKFLFVLGPYIL